MIDVDTQGFEERFASLEDASRLLSVDVQNLNEALHIIAVLSTEQAAQRLRQDVADRSLADAKDAAAARERRIRRAVGGLSLGLAILLPLVSIFVYVALISHVNDLLSNQKLTSFRSCTIRNQGTTDNRNRELALAQADKDPDVRKIHRDSAASLAHGYVDCSIYKPKP